MMVDSPHSPFFHRWQKHKEVDDKSFQNSAAASVMVPGYEDDYVLLDSRSPSPTAISHLTSVANCNCN